MLIQDQLAKLRQTLDMRLDESNKTIREQSGKNIQFVQQQTDKNIVMVKEITKEIAQELERVSTGQTKVMGITEQLKGLEDILKNPKQRGIHGERQLEMILGNILPAGMYKMQYPLKNGIVDAVIFYPGKKVIPIDAKFSLENYKQILAHPNEKEKFEDAFLGDLKIRIDETSKYVSEETLNFAVVYIPAQSVYDFAVDSDRTINGGKSIIEYAAGKKVNIASPLTFYAMLQTILTGLEQIKFNKHGEEIQKQVGRLGKHLDEHDKYLKRLGVHLETSVNMYHKGYEEFQKMNKDIHKISGIETNVDSPAIAGPETGEE